MAQAVGGAAQARWLSAAAGATLEDAAIVVAYLAALGGTRHAQAVATLRGLVKSMIALGKGQLCGVGA